MRPKEFERLRKEDPVMMKIIGEYNQKKYKEKVFGIGNTPLPEGFEWPAPKKHARPWGFNEGPRPKKLEPPKPEVLSLPIGLTKRA